MIKPTFESELRSHEILALYGASFIGSSKVACVVEAQEYFQRLKWAGILHPTLIHSNLEGERFRDDQGYAYTITDINPPADNVNQFVGIYLSWITNTPDELIVTPHGHVSLEKLLQIGYVMDEMGFMSSGRTLRLTKQQMDDIDKQCYVTVKDKTLSINGANLQGFRLLLED